MTLIQSIVNGFPAWLRRQEERWSETPGPALLAGTGVTALMLGLLVASPRTLRPSYEYSVGDFATSTIRAPWDLSVADMEGTAKLRDDAARYTPPVATVDPAPADALGSRVAEVFGQARGRVAEADSRRVVPEGELAKLGTTARRRLQQARSREADEAVQATLQEMLTEVERGLGVELTAEGRTLLAEGRFDRRLEDGLTALLAAAHSRRIADDLPQLREVAERSRRPGEPARVTLRRGTATEDLGLSELDDVPGAQERMRAKAPELLAEFPPSEQAVLARLASRLVEPDTRYDEPATVARRAQAAEDVLPISLQFRRNQLIVDEGREVTREALLVLDHLRLDGMPRVFIRRAAGTTVVAWVLLAALLWLPARVGLGPVPLRDAAFALAALIGATAACWGWLIVTDAVSAMAPEVSRTAMVLLFPVAAVPMLAGLVLPPRVLVGLCVAIAVCAGLLANLGVFFTTHAFVVGLVAGQLVVPCRQRSGIIRAGGKSGLVALVTGLGVAVLSSASIGAGEALVSAAAAGAGAAAAGFVALALSRPVEWLFGYRTKLGLVELLSYDHPLLRRFMERAPGTFQHSVSVALLAQTAAEAIGADALLVRVGALYHDVGKMETPEFFTENQRNGNPHDTMDPLDSARVILAHVGRGVELLRQYRVGGRVADFAQEHHGTGAVTVFLQKAEAGGQSPDPADYRYPGPRPRSRETAVLMMADKIEAIVRSRGTASEEEFRAVAERTIDDLRTSGQLDDSPLTLRDLARLQDAFVSILTSLHHKRVDYPAQPRPIPAGRPAGAA